MPAEPGPAPAVAAEAANGAAEEITPAAAASDRPWDADPLFQPFKRQDYYGELGLRPLGALEQTRLALLAVVVVPLKLLGALACLVAYYLVCRASLLLPAALKAEVITAAGRLACRACLFCLGFTQVQWIHVEPAGAAPGGGAAPGRRAGVIVSNHCGWSDILVHMSRSFPAFVARDATKSMPLIGLIRWAAVLDRRGGPAGPGWAAGWLAPAWVSGGPAAHTFDGQAWALVVSLRARRCGPLASWLTASVVMRRAAAS